MKTKMLFNVLLSTCFVSFGCGQNAHIKRDSDKVIPTTETSTKTLTPEERIKRNNRQIGLHIYDADLGSVLIGSTQVVPVKMINKGNTIIKSVKISAKNKNIEEFNFYGSIQPGEVRNIKVRVKDIFEGIQSQELVAITSDGVTVEGQKVNLKYKGVEDNNSIGLELYNLKDKVIDFGTVLKGEDLTRELVIRNTSNRPAKIDSILLGAKNNYSAKLTSLNLTEKCEGKIKRTCVLAVSFKPTVNYDLVDEVLITYSYGDKMSYTLRVKVIGNIGKKIGCSSIIEKTYMPKKIGELLDSDRKVALPYLVQVKNTDITLPVLLNQGYNQTISALDSTFSYVEDAQLYSVFETSSDHNLGTIVSAQVYVELLKNNDTQETDHNSTEIFCLENNRACSGNYFYDSNYRKHISSEYELRNDKFWTLFAQKAEVENVIASKSLLEFKGDIDLSILGEDTFKSIEENPSVKIFFADDLKHLAMPVLRVQYRNKLASSKECE